MATMTSTSTPATISPHELRSRLEGQQAEPPLLVDVRTPAEHGETHLPQARLIPMDALDAQALRNEVGTDREVILICRSGGRASRCAEKLAAAGMARVGILAGGMQAWNAAGLPAHHGKKVMSLERQVRIAAGLLVLMGVGLGFGVHPGFFGLSAFVGAGLVFAGLTDWCGMGLLLSKAPWNQAR